MDGVQLRELLVQSVALKEHLRGIFARDTMRRLGSLIPGAYVCNCCDSHRPGSHWVAFFKKTTGPGIFFDSLGRTPEYYGLVFPGENRALTNRHRVQSDQSSSCGIFCTFVLHWLCLGCDYGQILDLFSKEDLEKNERILTEFVEHLKKCATR